LQGTVGNNGQGGLRSVRPVPARLLDMMIGKPSRCLECGGSVEPKDGDMVCMNCGLVYGINYSDDRIPFGEYDGDGHFEGCYNPVNNSDYGKALGTVVDTQLKAAVLAGPDGPGPLEYFRAKNLRIKLDEKLVIDFLKIMNTFCKKHALSSKHDVAQIRFRDQLGLNLRYLAEYFLKYKALNHDKWIVVAASFTGLLMDLYPERHRALMGKSPELSLDPAIISYYEILLRSLQVPLLPSLSFDLAGADGE